MEETIRRGKVTTRAFDIQNIKVTIVLINSVQVSISCLVNQLHPAPTRGSSSSLMNVVFCVFLLQASESALRSLGGNYVTRLFK